MLQLLQVRPFLQRGLETVVTQEVEEIIPEGEIFVCDRYLELQEHPREMTDRQRRRHQPLLQEQRAQGDGERHGEGDERRRIGRQSTNRRTHPVQCWFGGDVFQEE